MNSKQLYFVLLGVIGLLAIALVGGAYGVDRLLSAQSLSLVDSRRQVAVLAAEQAQLAKAKQDIKKYQELADIAKSIVPHDKDQAQTVRQIVDLARANGVSLSTIAFPNSTLGATGSSTSIPSQLTAVPGVAGVYNLQLTIQSDPTKPVSFTSFIAFLDALEHNRRTAQVSNITIQPNTKDRSTLSFNLLLNEYIQP